MYCPKCKQKFEEGSRRFCPTDGARLVSDSAGDLPPQGGIFANLIPKMEGISDLGAALSDVPGVVVSDLERDTEDVPKPEQKTDEVFFELDDHDTLPPLDQRPIVENEPLIELSPVDSPKLPSPAANQVPVQAGRKVDPSQVPAGHIVLGSGDSSVGGFPHFDTQDPNSFVGSVVKGRYKVIEYLGGDESGLAYLAEDMIAVEKKVVVRVVLSGESDELMNSILSEERVSLSHFSHPNIARMIDSGEFADGKYFLISEYVDALSVADILGIHGRFSAQRASRVIRQISNALNEAHQEGILHRDIRPENLIIKPGTADSEQAVLVNFGASRGESTARNILFQSPEVLDGRINTGSSDIFALAVVSFQMLTGQTPFNGSSPKEILKAQYGGLVTKPTDVRPGLPVAINDVFEKALSFKPAGRYTKARDFGDAFCLALSSDAPAAKAPQIEPQNIVNLQPLVPAIKSTPAASTPPATKRADSSEKKSGATPKPDAARKKSIADPAPEQKSRTRYAVGVTLLALLAALAIGWYYYANNPAGILTGSQQNSEVNANTGNSPAISDDTEQRPLPRSLAQPPNTNTYQNSKQNLKGDLLTNFLGFTLFYPKDWKVNDPQQGTSSGSRGKFLDISRSTSDDRLQEQMLISYYPSKGTFSADSEIFPQLVRETNETLSKILPGYQVVSQGETTLNGAWRAYEIKFQGGGTSPSGEKLEVWGRRLFVPAARTGARNGFEITMLATSLAGNVKSVDEVGVVGELGPVLYSFEPSQN